MDDKETPFSKAAAAARLAILSAASMPAATVVALSAIMAPSSPCIVDVAKDAPPPPRFSLISRTGCVRSYPYSYVGLIECPTPELVVIHCNSREIEKIEIHGRGLDQVATLLATQRLFSVRECDHAEFFTDGSTVTEIFLVIGNEEPSGSDATETL